MYCCSVVSNFANFDGPPCPVVVHIQAGLPSRQCLFPENHDTKPSKRHLIFDVPHQL
jgi:hypothetical protein